MIITPYEKYLIYLNDDKLSIEEQASLVEKFAKKQMQKYICEELKLAMSTETNLGVRNLYAKYKFLRLPVFDTKKEKTAVLVFALQLLQNLGSDMDDIFDMYFSIEADSNIEELPFK